jgi:NRPS condensation-like uncharacterized protein
MEEPENPMVVSGVLELDARVTADAVRARLGERLVPMVRFSSRVRDRGLGGAPTFEPCDVDLAWHVPERTVGSEGELFAFVGAEVGTLLDATRPLWRVHVIQREPGGTTLLFRVHHAIADGFSLLSVLLSLCDAPHEAAQPPKGSGRSLGSLLGYTRSALRLLFLPPDPRSTLKAPLGTEKRIAWTRPISLDLVKSAAHAHGATVNDLLVSAIAGALRQTFVRRRERCRDVRAMVPVNLREGSPSADEGNHFGLVVLDLPVSIGDAHARLAAVKASMDVRKATREAVVAHVILRAMGFLPRALEGLGVAFFATKSSLVLTNVPGPKERVSFLGATVDRILFWVPQSGRMGLGVSVFSYAGSVTVGVMSDARVIDDPAELARAIEREVRDLLPST